MDAIRAPWTAEQVAALNAFQQAGTMHPFTCGGGKHPGIRHNPDLVATTDGWVCPYCDYTQDWAHAMMADPAVLAAQRAAFAAMFGGAQ